MDLSYDELRRIHRLEKNTSNLVEVDPAFFDDLASFLKSEKDNYMKSLNDFSFSKARDFTNLKRMVEEIFSLREKKLLNRALVASRTNEVSFDHMASQEKEAFKKILKTLECHNDLLQAMFSSSSGSEKKGKSLKDVAVKILSDVPAFVGTDMKEYGPYSKGVEIELPSKIAKLLESRKMAKIVK